MTGRRPLFSTPVALFAGCCVIAVAVYLGLRARPAGPLATGEGAEPVAPSAVQPGVQSSGQPGDRGRAAAQAAIRAVFAASKARWVETCWRPSVARQAQPDRVVYDFDVSFAADGRQTARGIVEQREFARADVAQCLRAQPMDMRIPAPGTAIRTVVRVELP